MALMGEFLLTSAIGGHETQRIKLAMASEVVT